MRETSSTTYSEPSSPDQFNNATGYFDSNLQSPESHFHPPAPVASYNPRYEDPAAASMNSLQRTLMEAEAAVSRGEFDNEFRDQRSDDHFGGPLSYGGFPVADRAQFPEQTSHAMNGFDFNGGVFPTDRFSEPLLTQPLVLQEQQESQGFGCFVNMGEDDQPMVATSVPTFPSQLLGHGDHDLTPRPFPVQGFSEDEMGSEMGSSPVAVNSRFKSPPPPADLAARRSRARPAALGASALRDKSTGPKTVNPSEAVKRLHGSPTAAMRRAASASGLNVLAGRVQKQSQLPQRSPLKRNFTTGTSTFLELNAHVRQMPVRNRSWLSTPRGPPTPGSPREMPQELYTRQDDVSQHEEQTPQDRHTPCSSNSESDGSYMYDRAGLGCFSADGMMPNMVSPPETPANAHGAAMHWNYETETDALMTPGFTSFMGDGIMRMPQPQYVSPLTASQPQTPAFGQFNGFPYAQHSPVFEMVPSLDQGGEYFFGDNSMPQFAVVASSKCSPDQGREKTYTFNNATQKDFESS
jgi:hypothetical protein